VNRSRNYFFPEGNALRVPLFQIKRLSQRLLERWERGNPTNRRDFYIRTAPSNDEMNYLIRTGAFDAFGQSRTEQFEARTLLDSIPIRKATD
jgi:DNA polymerase III alpha subunit